MASHIKPWRHSNDHERLDPFNGLLLQPTIDKLFDLGLVSFSDKGDLLRASSFASRELDKLGLGQGLKLRAVNLETRKYLEYHRDVEFQKNDDA
jgi:predicted restriction endonuclease